MLRRCTNCRYFAWDIRYAILGYCKLRRQRISPSDICPKWTSAK